MKPEELRSQVQFEDTLRPGTVVEIRWTNSHHYYAGRAKVVRVNLSTVRAELLNEVLCVYGQPYPIGRQIVAPRFAAQRWSGNNGVFPAKEFDEEERPRGNHAG